MKHNSTIEIDFMDTFSHLALGTIAKWRSVKKEWGHYHTDYKSSIVAVRFCQHIVWQPASMTASGFFWRQQKTEEKEVNEDGPIEFEVVGLVTTVPFQQCRLSVEKLHKTLPGLYVQPKIRSMMNVEWEEYTTKVFEIGSTIL